MNEAISLKKRIVSAALPPLRRWTNRLNPSRLLPPVIISGSPRGGTTWMAESIAAAFDRPRLMWEPLQDGNPEKWRYPFSGRPFFDGSIVAQRPFFEKLLQGEMVNVHTLRLRQFPRNIAGVFSSGQIIIKFVRGNGVAAALHKQFTTRLPLVIIRHPGAVVSSQLKMGQWHDHPHLDPCLLKYYPKLKKVAEKRTTLPERLAITWSADYLAAKFDPDNVFISRYEDILRDITGLTPLFQKWGFEDIPEGVVKKMRLPSSTTRSWSQLTSKENAMNGWKRRLDEKTIVRVADTVYECGVEEYDFF